MDFKELVPLLKLPKDVFIELVHFIEFNESHQQRMRFAELPSTRAKIAVVVMEFVAEPLLVLSMVSICGLKGDQHSHERKRISKYIWSNENYLNKIMTK